MVAAFKDPDIYSTPLKFHFVDEVGADAKGVSRDAYSAFWKEFFLRSSCGEAERVPCIFPEYGKDEWEAVGRILLKGYVDTHVFPIQLSCAFSVALICGESQLTPAILLDSYRNYISQPDRDVLDSALRGDVLDEDSKEDFLDMLSRVDCHTIPKGEEVRPLVLSISHKELIREPKYSLDAMANIARAVMCTLLPDAEAICQMYESKTPTPRKVIKLIVADPQDLDQSNVLTWLKQIHQRKTRFGSF
jgi:hypothetical protein